MKECQNCYITKEYDSFYRDGRSKDGYVNICKNCRKITDRANYLKKRRRILNKMKAEYEMYKDEYKIKSKLNYKKNKKKYIENATNYRKNRLKLDILYLLKHRYRSLIQYSYKSKSLKKNSKTQDILGCTFEEFKAYLESKFEPWMSWNNKGLYNGEFNYGWDIDHIIPLSSAKTEEDIIKLNHYTNLQPLCSYTNRYIKRNKKTSDE
jgi:hypothetical protein